MDIEVHPAQCRMTSTANINNMSLVFSSLFLTRILNVNYRQRACFLYVKYCLIMHYCCYCRVPSSYDLYYVRMYVSTEGGGGREGEGGGGRGEAGR